MMFLILLPLDLQLNFSSPGVRCDTLRSLYLLSVYLFCEKLVINRRTRVLDAMFEAGPGMHSQ
jgi:hypothetical protein